MTVNLEPIKAQLDKDIGGYICLHRDDMAALVSEVEHLRGERAAVVAWLREEAEPSPQSFTVRGKEWAKRIDDVADYIERGEHRREEGA